MRKGNPIKSIMQISKVIMFQYLVYVCCQHCERPYNEAHFKEADSSYSFSDVLRVQHTLKPLHCINMCLLHTRCVGARFVPSSGHCHMYATYQTKTTAGARASGDKYYIIQENLECVLRSRGGACRVRGCGLNKDYQCVAVRSSSREEHSGECGPPNTYQSFIYQRECVLAITTVCSSTKAFLGINTTVWCIPGPPTWTPAPGKCINRNPIRTKGTFLHPLDSGVSFIGTPNGNTMSVYFITASGDYLLKLSVIIDQQAVQRKSRSNAVWSGDETNLLAPFPFDLTKMFTMDIISTATEFVCKVNGATLFTYQHRLPRDSVDVIKVFEANIEKVLLI